MKNTLFITMILLLASCATRTKDVQKQATNFRFDAAIDTTAEFSAKVDMNAATTSSEANTSSFKEIDYDGQTGDSLSVTEYGADGKVKNKLVVHGKGKAKIKQGESASKKETTEAVKLKEETKIEAAGSKKVSGAGETVNKTKKVESSGFSFWFWLWIIIICIVLVLLCYLNRQFGWFGRIKKYVLNKKAGEDTFA